MAWANPSAEVVGYLLRHARVVDPDLLTEVAVLALRQFAAAPRFIDMHDLLCWERWARSLGPAQRAAVADRLKSEAAAIVAKQESEWDAYGAEPLMLAPTPASLVADALAPLLPLNLDYEIRRQRPDGSWRPTWSWGRYPDEWALAEVAWSGRITVERLRSLKAYGRIA